MYSTKVLKGQSHEIFCIRFFFIKQPKKSGAREIFKTEIKSSYIVIYTIRPFLNECCFRASRKGLKVQRQRKMSPRFPKTGESFLKGFITPWKVHKIQNGLGLALLGPKGGVWWKKQKPKQLPGFQKPGSLNSPVFGNRGVTTPQ
jgi:hypothetical protein